MDSPIIVFGATGAVGSSAAIATEKQGTPVILAVRDLSKPIPGLSAEEEEAGKFRRVQADLTEPESINAAVSTTGAKRALIYLVHGSTDHGKAAAEALKEAGIEFAVFLSSAGVQGDPANVTPEAWIPFVHAQNEVQLATIFGPGGYVALRPGCFASNLKWWTSMIAEGDVRIAHPDARVDWITPEDIGKAASKFLVHGATALQSEGAVLADNAVLLCGPKCLSFRDAIGAIGRATSRDIKVTRVSKEEEVEALVKIGLPETIVEQLVDQFVDTEEHGDDSALFGENGYPTGVANLQTYASPTISLEEWATIHKQEFKQ